MKLTNIITSFILLFSIGTTQSQCFFTSLNVNVGACNGVTGNYKVIGELEFINAPSTGTLNIEVNNGVTIYDTIINPVFSSPQTWSISNIPSDGAAFSVTAYFSSEPTCSISLNYNAPINCTCIAEVGTFSNSILGDGVNDYVLCFGDQIDLSSNLDYTSPSDQNIGGISYDPGIAYLAYSCPPTVFATTPLYDNFGIPNDSCLIGLVSFGDDFSDQNILGEPSYAGTFSNNTIYYVPITTYSNTDGYYAISVSGGPWCYDMGAAIAVTYLPEITSTEVVDSVSGEVTVTVSGGYPGVFSGQYSIVNNGIGTLSSAIVDSSGGSFTISGLNGGSFWDCTITDGNGCGIVVADTLPGSLSINELQLDFSISPIPSRDFIRLEFPSLLNAQYVVVNQIGEIVMQGGIVGDVELLDIGKLDAGIYFMRVMENDTYYSVKRFIKE